MERRRNGHEPGQSPIDTLNHLPALVVLERIPVPVLDVAHDGALMFANSAFSEMVGRASEDVLLLLSRSALIRADDDVALATFRDLTEQLWLDES